MDYNKNLENPLKLKLYKKVYGANGVSKDEKGKIINEWQPLTYASISTFEKYFKGVVNMGYTIVRVEDFGDFPKDIYEIEYKKIFGESKPKEDSNDILLRLLKENEEMKDQLAQLTSGVNDIKEETQLVKIDPIENIDTIEFDDLKRYLIENGVTVSGRVSKLDKLKEIYNQSL